MSEIIKLSGEMKEIKLIDNDIKEFYEDEIKSIYEEIERVTRSFYYLDYYEEVGEEISEEVEKACDKLYESEQHLSKVLKLLKVGD